MNAAPRPSCATCSGPLPAETAPHRRYCSEPCKQAGRTESLRRRAVPRARSIAAKHLTRDELAQVAPDVVDVERPRTRGDCSGGERPCPWISCSHHLYLDVTESSGTIKLNFPFLEPDELDVSCSLDVADSGGATLDRVGEILNLTRERVRQIETRALVTLRSRGRGSL